MAIDSKIEPPLEIEDGVRAAGIDQVSATDFGDDKAAQRSDELDDPHLAAAAENIGQKMSFRTLAAICFLGLSVCSPLSCSQLMIGPVVNSISTDLGMGAALTNWILAGWALAATVTVVVVGKISDIFGRRWVMIAGSGWALIGSIVAGTAQTGNQLVAGSVICGLSFGFIIIVFSALPELCPFKYRGLGLAWLEFCIFAPWGIAAGLISTLLTEHASWRYIYYIGVIYAGITLVGTYIFYYPPQGSEDMVGKSFGEVLRNFDYVGSVLFVLGLPVFILAFSWAGTPGHDWNSASVIAPLVVGAVTLLTAFIYEMRFANPAYAFMPARLMLNFREYSAHCVAGFVSGLIYYAGIVLIPQADLYIFGLSPHRLGLWLLPNGFGQFVGSTMVPGMLHLTKTPKLFICGSVFLQTLFTGLYTWAIPNHPGAWQAFQFFGQGCFDSIITCSVVNISLHVRQSDLGAAMGVFGAARNLGGCIGIAVFSTILSGTASPKLSSLIPAAARANGYQGHDIGSLIEAARLGALGVPHAFEQFKIDLSPAAATAVIQAFRDSYAYAYRMVFYSTIPFGVISFVVCLFIKDAGKYMTNHVSIHIKKRK